MSNIEELNSLLDKGRELYDEIQLFINKKTFEKNVYDKINVNIDNLITQLEYLLKKLGNNPNETDENKLFIINLGGIKHTLSNIKKHINPSFRISDDKSWLIVPILFKSPSPLSLSQQQQLNDCLVIFGGSLNFLEDLLLRTHSNNLLKL